MDLLRGGAVTFPTQGRLHLRVLEKTSNVAEVELLDRQAVHKKYPAVAGSGLVLDSQTMTNPLLLRIVMHHYGGTNSAADVDVQW